MRKGKSVKNNQFILYMGVISVLFATSFYIANAVFPVGDQIWFREQARLVHYHYIGFGVERYFIWSSRLLIESLTMFLSVHESLFPLIAFVATMLFLSVSRDLSPHQPMIPGILLFAFFPVTLFVGAGPIPTYINYVLPAFMLVFSLYYRKNSYLLLRIISLFAFLFAVMQEQLAVYAFMWLVFKLYKEFCANKISQSTLLYAAISFGGIASAIFAPGNILRIEQEMATWFPTFHQLNIFQKISLGVLETGQATLMISKTSLFSVCFICILCLVALFKRKYISLGITSMIGFMMLATKMGFQTPLSLLFSVSTEVKGSREIVLNSVNLSAVAGYFSIFFMLLLALYMAIGKSYRSWLLYVFCIGIVGRMLVSFSPTIYASGARTMLPLTLSLYIIACHLLDDIWSQRKQVHGE